MNKGNETMYRLTAEDLRLMRSAVGQKSTKNVYQNQYVTDEGHDADERWQALCQQGLAEMFSDAADRRWYRLTPAGMILLGVRDVT